MPARFRPDVRLFPHPAWTQPGPIVAFVVASLWLCGLSGAAGQTVEPNEGSVRPAAIGLQPAQLLAAEGPTNALTDAAQELGAPDSAPDGPPAAQGPPKGFGPPPPPRFAVDSWWIGPSIVEGSNARIAMSFLSIGGGKRYTFGRTFLSVRPQFQMLFLGGPAYPGPDLPAQLYALTTDIQVEQPLSRKTSVTLGVTPGLYTDWENLSGDAVRVPARLFVSHVLNPKLILIGGVVYTAQPAIPIIPAAGLIWSPTETWRLELIAPRPRLVYRWSERLQIYGQLSFDSSTYAIRFRGRDDLLEYRDFRVSMGTEWTTKQKLRLFSEVGAAFARDLDTLRQTNNTVDPGIFVARECGSEQGEGSSALCSAGRLDSGPAKGSSPSAPRTP